MTRLLAALALASSITPAQAPKIAEINFYGVRKLSPEELLSALAIRAGGPLPPSKGNLEDRLLEVPGVVDARVEAVCCEGGETTLFIGIEERGAPHFNTRGEPAGSAVLPGDLLDRYHDYLSATGRAARAGAADPEVARLRDAFTAFAAEQTPLLRDILRYSSEPEQRTAAAAIIAFAPRKAEIVGDLQYALQDSEESVRANAARSLRAIAIEDRKHPEPGLKIAPVWLVEMLNSIVLSDRMEAVRTLVVLSDQPNEAVLSLLRERALPALAEMARWKTLDYALPAFLLLGRAEGIPEADLHRQWEQGDRETAIRRALSKR